MSAKSISGAHGKHANDSRATTLPDKIRVLLADDHAPVSEALDKLLEPEFNVVGRVSDSRALLQAALRLMPEVIVLDLNVLELHDRDAGWKLKELLPDAKIVAVSVNEDPDVAIKAMRAWASAFILKKFAGSELITAIREVLRGRSYLTTSIGKKADEKYPRSKWSGQKKILTSRQREVLQLLAEGHTMKEIARILKITPRTVAFHKYAMME